MLIKFENLDKRFQTKECKEYYDILQKKKSSLFFKRAFDILCSLILLILFSPVFLILAIWIRIDSKGKAIFKQKRVTIYGKEFEIYKFRTMVSNAQSIGTSVTVENDARITKVGSKIRKCRLDEIPQLINVLKGDMTFVGTRPEVLKYVECYSDEMYATLLMRAGITSIASIEFKDEDELLANSQDADKTYINDVLPQKMKYNLRYIKDFSFLNDIKICIQTVVKVFA